MTLSHSQPHQSQITSEEMIMVMADSSQTRILGKTDGQFLYARWLLLSLNFDAQTQLFFFKLQNTSFHTVTLAQSALCQNILYQRECTTVPFSWTILTEPDHGETQGGKGSKKCGWRLYSGYEGCKRSEKRKNTQEIEKQCLLKGHYYSKWEEKS